MSEWVYSLADRCTACSLRAILPSRKVAKRFAAFSGGRLGALECPVGNGWHLVVPDREPGTIRRR